MVAQEKGTKTSKEQFKRNLQVARRQDQNLSQKSKAVQVKTNDIVKQTERRHVMLDWMEKTYLPNWDRFENDPKYKGLISQAFTALEHSINWTKKTDSDLSDTEIQLDIAVSSAILSAASLATIGDSASSQVTYILTQSPDDTITLDPLPLDREDIGQELDQRLTELDPTGKLVNRRQGAWQIFRSGSQSNLSAACHEMRDILTLLLDHIADNKLVKQAEWWKYVKETRDGVSKRQKITYLICGKRNEDIDELDIEKIGADIDHCKKIHDELCAIAHWKPEHTESVRSYLAAMEDILITILEYRHRIQQIRKSKEDVGEQYK